MVHVHFDEKYAVKDANDNHLNAGIVSTVQPHVRQTEERKALWSLCSS